ncbi:MAG: hypothetical protein HY690_20120 [Chloroflexi bacterium]|nr:hypothetical protein [Chloroflexota bacterium]
MDEEQTRRMNLVAGEQTEGERSIEQEQVDPGLMAQPPSFEQPAAYVSLGLTVGDGFKFGCGLVLAFAIAALVGLLLASLVFLAASLIGVPVPLGRG